MPSGTLTADFGTYALTGTDANLVSKIAAETGSYALTGTASSLRAALVLPAATDSYALTGTPVDLTADLIKTLAANSAMYSIYGSPINLTFAGFSVWTPISDKSTDWTDV